MQHIHTHTWFLCGGAAGVAGLSKAAGSLRVRWKSRKACEYFKDFDSILNDVYLILFVFIWKIRKKSSGDVHYSFAFATEVLSCQRAQVPALLWLRQ